MMREVVFTGVSVLLLLGNLAVIDASGRERAKRTVCVANLRQLASAWNLYADENDGKIVNEEADTAVNGQALVPSSGRHKNEKPWVGKDFASTYVAVGHLVVDATVQGVLLSALSAGV